MRYSEPLERATRRRDGPVVAQLSDDRFREIRDKDLRPRTVSPRRAVRATLVTLVLAALLTSGQLVEIAERQPFGSARDRWLGMAEAVDRVANFLSLNRPADLIAEIRGNDDPATQIDTIGGEVLEEVPGGATVTTTPAGEGSAAPEPTPTTQPGATTSTPETTAPPTTVPQMRVVTPADPLRVYVAGDSQVEFVGQSLTKVGEERGGYISVTTDFRISTGLARPDYFNWPAQLATVAAEQDHEAFVFFVGANDTQGMELDGRVLAEGSDEWRAEYQRRVAFTMDVLAGEGRHLFWVLQPPVRDGSEQPTVVTINQAIRAAAEGRTGVTLIESDVLFADASGGYAAELTTDQGRVERVRQDDGVHLTRTGSDWMARVIHDAFFRVWEAQQPAQEAPPTTAGTPGPGVS